MMAEARRIAGRGNVIDRIFYQLSLPISELTKFCDKLFGIGNLERQMMNLALVREFLKKLDWIIPFWNPMNSPILHVVQASNYALFEFSV